MAVTELTNSTGKDRGETLARWGRDGRVKSYVVLGGYDDQNRRLKTRHYTVFSKEYGRVETFSVDGRMPFMSEEYFARLAIAVMALT